ncbi:MAG TPA: AtpZ/AtpI family protein [Actinomycetota bacterium]|jgi:F0F1-type ATP synthase assembly protein I|nr:AtpZ/AtpI family protein [Actinomycetota bacterium]
MSEPDPEREPPARGADIVWSIIGTLIAGVLAWGGIGWLLDRWLGTRFLVAVGVIVGMAGAMYLIIKRHGSG